MEWKPFPAVTPLYRLSLKSSTIPSTFSLTTDLREFLEFIFTTASFETFECYLLAWATILTLKIWIK